MAYSDLTSTEIGSGKPVSNPLLDKVKENFTNHETRIDALETGTSTVYPPIIMKVNGNYGSYGGVVDFLKTTLNFNLTITGVRILVEKAGTSGDTEIDLKFKRGAGSYTSVLTTLPSCNYQDGDDFSSTGTANGSVAAVLNATYVDLQAGDILRLDITSAQAQAQNFIVRIDYNKT